MTKTFQKTEVGQDGIAFRYPGTVPTSKIVWPATQQRANQIQQTKGSAKPQVANTNPTVRPNQSMVAPRTTPAHVQNVRVVTNNQRQVTVQFTQPHNDPYYAGANVYLRKPGSEQPVRVAGGASSPLTFTLPVGVSGAHVIHVTSEGNWGETDVLKSPSHPVTVK